MSTGSKESKKIGLRFSEKMSGYLAQGVQDFTAGEDLGKKQNKLLSFEVTIRIDEVSDFCKLSGRKALLEGTVSFNPLGQNLPIRNGEFILFRPDRETGKRHMTYSGRLGTWNFLIKFKIQGLALNS
jgi:hypothetical protein